MSSQQPPPHNPYEGMDISMCPVHGKSAEQFIEQAKRDQQQQQQQQALAIPTPPLSSTPQQSTPPKPQTPSQYDGMDISMCPVHGKSAEEFMTNARAKKDFEYQHIQSSNFLVGAPRFPAATKPVETNDGAIVGDIFPDSKPILGQHYLLSSTPSKSSIPKSTRSTALPSLQIPEGAPQVPDNLKQAAQAAQAAQTAQTAQQQLACTSDEAADIILASDKNPALLPGKDYQEDTWTFPSHQRFYNAMKKKGWNPSEHDIPYIVSIHNTVNQQSWSRVMAYERYHQSSCPTPSLLKFQGRPTDLSPKARLRSLVGYTLPYDRHDWTIDRCGTNVRYVIDFYSGQTTTADAPISTYLDVRPALDSPGAFFDRARRSFEEYFDMK